MTRGQNEFSTISSRKNIKKNKKKIMQKNNLENIFPTWPPSYFFFLLFFSFFARESFNLKKQENFQSFPRLKSRLFFYPIVLYFGGGETLRRLKITGFSKDRKIRNKTGNQSRY